MSMGVVEELNYIQKKLAMTWAQRLKRVFNIPAAD